MYVCVCTRARTRVCFYALRTVSTDKILHFINTLIITITSTSSYASSSTINSKTVASSRRTELQTVPVINGWVRDAQQSVAGQKKMKKRGGKNEEKKGEKLRPTSQSECTGAHADKSQLEKLPPLNCAGPKRLCI